MPKLVSNDDLFEEAEEVNSDDSNYSDSMSDTTAEWQSKVKPFRQSQLNDLVRDLALSIEASEVLASRLSEHGILDSKIKITFYCPGMKCFVIILLKKITLCFAKTSKAFLQQWMFPNTNRVSGVCL